MVSYVLYITEFDLGFFSYAFISDTDLRGTYVIVYAGTQIILVSCRTGLFYLRAEHQIHEQNLLELQEAKEKCTLTIRDFNTFFSQSLIRQKICKDVENLNNTMN